MAANETILCGKVVTPFRVIENGMVIVQGKRIQYAGPFNQSKITNDSQVIQADIGNYIVPGFFDIHCHGGGGVWGFQEPELFTDFHLQHGTTSLLATFGINESHQVIMDSLKRVKQAMRTHPSLAGVHLEGPYINPKYGAILAPIRTVNSQEYNEILACAGELIKVWTLAPEMDGQMQFMEDASNHHIVFSVGHSEAPPETIFDSVRFGMRLGCHLTNASGTTPSPSRYGGTLEVGVHDAVMLHDDMYAEVIPDEEGLHVRPLMLKLIVKTKGADRVIVITDAADEVRKPNGRDVRMVFANEFTPNKWEGEGLGGSLLTMDRAAHNMRLHTGIGMVDVCKMTSLNPARLLGLDRELGSLESGKKANLLAVTEGMEVKMVMLEGQLINI